MTAGSANGGDGSPPRLVKLSELARLSGVPRPTIKHYLRRGLLPGPVERTSRNMAYYDARLAARVRTIKELQRTRSLSLDTISGLLEPAPSHALRDDLDEHERRLVPDAAGRRAGRAAGHAPADPVRLTRAEVLAALRLSPDDLDALERAGLARPGRLADGEPVYSGAALHFLEIVHDARRTGYDALAGPDALARHAAALRRVVAAEIASWPGRLAGDPAGPAVDRSPGSRAELGARLLTAVHAAVLADALAGPRDPEPDT